ncbi:polyketide cyclase, partial [Mesorhizobium sp. M7A.F.Ca.US.001.01.1.1]
MDIHEKPTAEAGMLIRRPVAEVFEAFVDPAITTKFWFTHGSGRLDSGEQIHWEWRMYGVSTTVDVSEIVPNEKIVMQWSDPPTTVVWTFTEMPGETTFLEVRNFG